MHHFHPLMHLLHTGPNPLLTPTCRGLHLGVDPANVVLVFAPHLTRDVDYTLTSMTHSDLSSGVHLTAFSMWPIRASITDT